MKFSKTIKIRNKIISNDQPAFIIAEAGVNHNGDVELAKQLVDVAVASGADAVKFQAFRTSNLIKAGVKKATYQELNTANSETQDQMLTKLELPYEAYVELKNYCENKGILFLITPFDEQSLEELEALGVDAYKVSSTDITNVPFLKKVSKTGKPIILSTGMAYFDEVNQALKEILKDNAQVILLQCTSCYPAPAAEINLNVISEYIRSFDMLVGFSDHTEGLGASPFSIPLGAKVLEKHFTLDKNMNGPDHKASLDPAELKQFVTCIRNAEAYLGSPVKVPTPSEIDTRKSLQKCLVAAKDIQEGETFNERSFIGKRTGGIGISPMKSHLLIGKKASKTYFADEIIEETLT